MKVQHLTRAAFILVCLPLIIAAKDCTGCPTEPDDEGFSVVVDLENADVQPVHLFAPGETFPCCQVNGGSGTAVAGGVRHVQMTLKPGSNYEIRAGRNGQILATAQCHVTGGKDDQYLVVYTHTSSDGQHHLACLRGWR